MRRADGFVVAMQSAGLLVASVVADGRLRRVRAEGDGSGQRSGWYVLHAGPPLAGAYGNWKTGASAQWRDSEGGSLSAAELAEIREKARRAQRQQQAECARRHAAAREAALAQWRQADAASATHAYLVAKGVASHGLRQSGGHLLVPMRDAEGHLWSMQTIAADGSKRFLAGGRKRGLYYAIGREVSEVVCIAEGYATAASIYEATGYPTAVAFDAGNLEPVARELRNKFPDALIVLCADDDAATALCRGINPGLANAQRAAHAVGGVVALPPRSPDHS
ncbi:MULTISPECIES: toprim domain-containing protein [Xanthomonas]|jgi:putative DNA primase/helicase|uniref:toprim domain-containing protein n=1 Tax=Xanthomonas TaxID=338 RepID=UPI00070CEA86|nr:MULTISPECIES: toprim domain-containing protein [Xanthomonas]MDM7696977.1 toprim domain-containing protein [Xanthomonas campestris pv. campestris]NIJ86141.1 putative DNA primase/helicase [Xanthomonas arboricola]PPU38310.1 DNA primase [Xanthomonas arboricola pv. populi]